MLLIPCPWCGPRAEPEFTGGKQTGRIRPSTEPKPEPQTETAAKDAIEEDKAWAAYLFRDANAPERREERWCHTHGCGQWFVLIRDSGAGVVGKASRIAPPPPPPTAPPQTAAPTMPPPANDGGGS